MWCSSADILTRSAKDVFQLDTFLIQATAVRTHPARSQSDSGPEFLFPFIITYLTKHPCTSIVFVFSPRTTIYMHSALQSCGGWKKRAQENPVRKSFVFASRTLSFCTRGIAANAHLLYSDRCGACDEKKMSGFENQTRVGFQSKSLSFRTESRRTRLIFSPTIPPYRRTVACTSLRTTL